MRRFTLVGPGRAGMSLHGALADLGWECAAIYRRGADVSEAARGVDVCVIATPDAAIAGVAAAIQPGNAVLVHLSGATPLSALGDSNAVAALHPLQSLPNAHDGAAALRDCHYAVAGDPIAQEMAEALSGEWFTIADADRALYHCAAAVASNHSVALLGQVERLADSVGVPLEAFLPIVRASVENAFTDGPAAALTGPVARGDQATIDAHRAALGDAHPGEIEGYDAMVGLARKLLEAPAGD